MDEDILKILIPLVTGSAGVLIKSRYDTYKLKRNKKSKADLMDTLYTDLEKMYAKDLELQKELHKKAQENEKLRQIIKKWENGKGISGSKI